MYWLIIPAIVLVISVVAFILNDKLDIDSEAIDVASIVMGAIAVIILVVAMTLIPATRYEDRMKMASIESMRTTIKDQRAADISPLERVELTKEILAMNKWIAETKYANNTSQDIFHPDEVDNVQLIK